MPRKKEKRYHYLYKTINLINGKYYIGVHSTSNLEDGYLGSGKRLKYAISKYGKENFKIEILEFFESQFEKFQREKEIVNEQILQDPLCMNLKIGGEGSFGFVTVRDINKNIFSVKIDDPRYLSGELVGVNKDFFITKNSKNEKFRITKDDPRYISGELIGMTNGTKLNKNISEKDFVIVQDEFGKLLKINKNDERYISGELKFHWKGKKHKEESKRKIGFSNSKYSGEKSHHFGKCWIFKDGEVKKIIKSDIDYWIKNGWKRGRK